jgi:tetratricopeptide (TPR) repeat protein
VAATGLVVDESGFEVLAGGVRVGSRRLIGAGDAEFLGGLAARYGRAVLAGSGSGVLAGLGRELFGWLEGAEGQLTGLLERAGAPLVFEVAGPRSPAAAAWAVLRAPWELLARPGGGFLAQDDLTRFAVVRRLGAAGEPAGLDAFRLGVAFMASAPRDQPELDFEAEEAAVLAAVGESRVDLVVDDSGDPVQLGHRLAELGGMPVVHLSCHGHNSWPARPGGPGVPVLMMEDETGGGRPTTAGDLTRLLTARPRLLFVSACLTATGSGESDGLPPGGGRKGGDPGGGPAAQSLATALVTAGVPAVIGWDGSVRDTAATVFAARLYAALADRAGLAEAVGDARRALLESADEAVNGDWHLARLWLGPGGGGPLVAGTRKRSLIPATHGTQVFLAGKPQVPVASAEMFVGRRPQLQRSLRALRSGERTGVLLRGQGRLGKSSLAARIADRCPGYAVAVVFGDYTALGILDAVAAAVRAHPAARELIEARLDRVRERPEAIEAVLTDLLSGPCAQAGPDGGRPLLLVIDDLEQILVPDPGGPHRVAPPYAPTLAGVLRAFDPAVTDSRLLVTSRFAFTLGGLESRLEDVQLPPLSLVAQAKLLRRQQSLTSQQRQDERAGLAGRAVAVSRGNPGLQDLIGLRLVYGDQVPAERAEAAVTGMEDYLQRGALPAEPEVRAFLENLALDALLAEAGPASAELLRAATLFTLPVPEPVIDALAGAADGSPGRLRGLGLLDPYPDPADPDRTALAASPLAAGRLDPLTSAEQATLAAVATAPLFAAWGGTAAQRSWDASVDLQLTRLALLADDPGVTAACAGDAVAALCDGPAAAAFELGRNAIALLDRHSRRVPLQLLRQAAGAALTSGDGPAGEALLTRAARQAESGDEETSPLDKARVLTEQAIHLITRGEPEKAEELLRHACQLFTDAGSEGEAAVVMGSIADIAYQRGDYDEALRIRREVQLPAYERLGDTRGAAVTWGRIADIAFRRGDYDEALRIRCEIELPVYERLGDTRSATVTWGQIADITYQRGDYDEALRIRREIQLPAFERLGDTRSTAITWGSIADITYQRGDYDEALRIRREIQLPAFERLGDTRETAITWGQIADIAYRRGDYDEALRIRREIELPAFERLGDARETAITWGRIADIAYDREDYDEALRIRREVQLPVYERLGDTRGAAVTWGRIADIAYQRGDYDEAAELQEKRLEVHKQHGDLDGIAAASWGLARIDLDRQDYQAAMPRLIESFQINIQLQRPDGIAVVGSQLGELLLAAGQDDQGRQVLEAAVTAAAKIGWTDMARQISQLLQPQPPDQEP